VLTGTLRFKPPPNCGCVHGGTRHGHTAQNSKTWRAWNSMRQRCENTRHRQYKDYGGRGIKVCDRWQVFEHFLIDMGEAPADLTLERLDNNGDYEPANCAWRSRKAQSRNRRDNRQITYKGQTKCLSEWAEQYSLSKSTLKYRIDKGWTLGEALTLPATKTNSVLRRVL
jgi:hypothetical protein